jgi:hypothetical protein
MYLVLRYRDHLRLHGLSNQFKGGSDAVQVVFDAHL